jgi:hypothetical protein
MSEPTRKIYFDLEGQPHFFDPAECEEHPFDQPRVIRHEFEMYPPYVFLRLPGRPGIWLKQIRGDWQQFGLAVIVPYFRRAGVPLPPSLFADIEASPPRPEGLSKPPTTTKPEDVGEDTKLPTPTPLKPKAAITSEDRRQSVKAMIESLLEFGLWGVSPSEIANRCHINIKTLYRYLKHPTVRSTWESYEKKSVGKIPANLDDLGDDRPFSFLDRD